MVATERDRAIADALAAQVTAANGSGKTWRKMTSLLDMWGHNRLTPAVKARMADALEQRFEVSPPLQELSRHNTVRLALRNSAYANGPASFHRSEHTGDSLPPEIVRVTHWRTAQAPVSAALRPLADNEDGFLWIDVNVSADPERLCELLDPVCGDEVDHGMVEDLLLADALPKVDEYTEDGRIRKVVAFGTRARRAKGERHEGRGTGVRPRRVSLERPLAPYLLAQGEDFRGGSRGSRGGTEQLRTDLQGRGA